MVYSPTYATDFKSCHCQHGALTYHHVSCHVWTTLPKNMDQCYRLWIIYHLVRSGFCGSVAIPFLIWNNCPWPSHPKEQGTKLTKVKPKALVKIEQADKISNLFLAVHKVTRMILTSWIDCFIMQSNYLMVLIHAEANAIQMEMFKTQADADITKAYFMLQAWLVSMGIQPKLQ